MNQKKWQYKLFVVVFIPILILSACSGNQGAPVTGNQPNDTAGSDQITGPNDQNGQTEGVKPQEISFNPPKIEDAGDDPLGQAVKLGYKLMMETNTVLDDYVGNQLSCASCHANGGLDLLTSPLVGVTTAYPQYRAREGEILTIEDRINGCFLRSMNGEALPMDSEELKAMTAYLTYISEGIPVGAEIPWRGQNNADLTGITVNVDNGEQLYQQSCVACHAIDGSGTGPISGPALWGENSFNDGAGLARISKLTAFIQRTMPKFEVGGVKQGELTLQEAADIAAYILQQERPEFKGKANDWPKGGKPDDVPY